MRPANLAQQTPPPGQAAGETRANRRARTGQPPPPAAAARAAGLSWARCWAGKKGEGRAAPLKRAAARAGAAEPRSQPEPQPDPGRACVCLCFAPARSSASRGAAAKVCGVFSSSPLPCPASSTTPLLPPTQASGQNPGTARAAPFFPLRPWGRRTNVSLGADGPLSVPKHRKDGKKGDKQPRGCSQKVQPGGNGHFGVLCVLYSRGRRTLRPLSSQEGRAVGWGASRNINLPTGREAPSLPGCQKTRTSTFITSLLPLLPS